MPAGTLFLLRDDPGVAGYGKASTGRSVKRRRCRVEPERVRGGARCRDVTLHSRQQISPRFLGANQWISGLSHQKRLSARVAWYLREPSHHGLQSHERRSLRVYSNLSTYRCAIPAVFSRRISADALAPLVSSLRPHHGPAGCGDRRVSGTQCRAERLGRAAGPQCHGLRRGDDSLLAV